MGGEIGLYSLNHIKTRVDANGQASSSQERIVDGVASCAGTGEVEKGSDIVGNGLVINKTVEVEFLESAA